MPAHAPRSSGGNRTRLALAPRGRGILFACAALVTVSPCYAARADAPAETDFTALSLEELMDVEVTSVSKRPQRLADAAAAVFVISQEDIRRSGATNIPELLRMAPGVDVARIDASRWAVSIRGFNARFSNKLLVLIDGRSVYNPLFADVVWDVQDVVLEDVERIEVIRGPGATLWGSYAVNGVINIITKNARDTQGVLFSGGGGTEPTAFGTTRYGGQIGDDLYYRAYAKAFKIDDGAVASGDQGADATTQGRAGFRADWAPTGRDTITLAGDLFTQDYGSTAVTQPLLVPPYSLTYDDNGKSSGGNISARWNRRLSSSSDVSLQASFDRLKKEELGLSVETEIVDVELQHSFELFERNRIVWGLGYRYNHAAFNGGALASFDPDHRSDSLLSAFLQDEIALIPDELRFVVGSKLEHNDSTGLEVQPTARILWAPTPNQALWGSVSRAVRLPSIGEEDASLVQAVIPPGTPANPAPFPAEVRLFGNRDLDSEELMAFEAGYRIRPAAGLSFDVATFYNIYDKLRSGDIGSPAFVPFPVPRIVIPVDANDKNSGEAYGVEVSADWEVLPWWRLKAAYSFLRVDLDMDTIESGNSPRHQASLRSMMDLGGGWQFDLWPRYVDNLPALGVESYFDLDARLAWRPSNTVEFAIVGQNLIDSRRKEFVPESLPLSPTQAQRGVYAKLTLTF